MARRVAISTRILADRSVLEILETIRDSGFEALEICAMPGHFDPQDLEAVSEVRRSCEGLSLGVISLHAPYAAPVDITVVQRGERQLAVREVLMAAEALATLGGEHLVIHPGSEIAPGPYTEARHDALRESLCKIHERCIELGVSLLLEEMEPHCFGGEDADIDWLLALRPRPFHGFCLDVAHSFLSGSLVKRLHRLRNELGLIHVGDVRGQSRQHEHLLPGEGEVPWSEVMQAIGASAGDVPLVLEVDRQTDPEALTRARAAMARVLAPA